MIEMITKIGGINTTASFRSDDEREKFMYFLERTGITINNCTLIFDNKTATIDASYEIDDLKEQFDVLFKRFEGKITLNDSIECTPVWESESSIKIYLKVTTEKPTSYDNIFEKLKPIYATKEAELRNYFWDKQTQYIPAPTPVSTEEKPSTEETAEGASGTKPEICTEEDIEKYLAENLF